MLYLLCLHEEFAIAEKRECCCHCLECESLELGLCVWAGMTHCLHQSAVDGLCLAVAAFSQTVVVLCAANSGLHKGKRGGIICGFVLVLHIGGEKRHKMIKLSKTRTKSCSGKFYPSLFQMGVSITVIQRMVMYS